MHWVMSVRSQVHHLVELGLKEAAELVRHEAHEVWGLVLSTCRLPCKWLPPLPTLALPTTRRVLCVLLVPRRQGQGKGQGVVLVVLGVQLLLG